MTSNEQFICNLDTALEVLLESGAGEAALAIHLVRDSFAKAHDLPMRKEPPCITKAPEDN